MANEISETSLAILDLLEQEIRNELRHLQAHIALADRVRLVEHTQIGKSELLSRDNAIRDSWRAIARMAISPSEIKITIADFYLLPISLSQLFPPQNPCVLHSFGGRSITISLSDEAASDSKRLAKMLLEFADGSWDYT